MDGGSETMTLAFELDALKACRFPDEVFSDALQWTENLGIISDQPSYVTTTFTREHSILREQDFFSGPYSRQASLEDIRESFDTDRYVFVGTTEGDRELGEAVAWEYIDITDAADAADWELADTRSTVEG